MKIWLDDIRTPPDGSWKWFKTAEDAIDWFRLNHDVWDVEILSLDNDLGEGRDEGYKVLDWLEEKKFYVPNFVVPKKIQVHSANPVARGRMEQSIERMVGSNRYRRKI